MGLNGHQIRNLYILVCHQQTDFVIDKLLVFDVLT